MLIQEMTKNECLHILASTRLGRLACVRENQPYIVPIYFVYDEHHLYSFTSLGQKIEWMRCNPLVCVELDEVKDSNNWTSVVIFGQYEELPTTSEWEQELPLANELGQRTVRSTGTSSPEQSHAFALLQKHAEWWDPASAYSTLRNPDLPLVPVFYRIRIDRITGRRATPGPGGPGGSKKLSAAGKSQSWLQRIFHAFSKPHEA
jgi:nitroimidazol reductase NimA-like FMN-containing flavoprotein (pyridoxamine 5'-phosphate oxidase superfamily)